jgi:hypothetical protein
MATFAWIAGSLATTGGLAFAVKKIAGPNQSTKFPPTIPSNIQPSKEDHHG